MQGRRYERVTRMSNLREEALVALQHQMRCGMEGNRVLAAAAIFIGTVPEGVAVATPDPVVQFMMLWRRAEAVGRIRVCVTQTPGGSTWEAFTSDARVLMRRDSPTEALQSLLDALIAPEGT